MQPCADPAIFTPAWFVLHDLLPGNVADNAQVQVVHPQIAAFTADWLHLQATTERLSAETSQAPHVRVCDLVARLTDLTAGAAAHEQEEATIPLTELSDHDAARIADGSVFRWVIGYERSPAGTRKRVSRIVLRDLPAVTEADLRDGEEWARETIRALGR